MQLAHLAIRLWGSTIIKDQQVPFSQMWSPSLCPRPADWPPHSRVVGFFFWDQQASLVDESSPQFAPLCQWLSEGDKPIFIGFGSMVFDGTKTARLIVEAARLSGKRVLMQTSTEGGRLECHDLPPNVFSIGRCAHDWLLPKVAAVIHHGGAGTVGAGLKLALPTMCCPFFGDQFFYGHCVAASGCGPPPIPFSKLTVQSLADSFNSILHPQYAEGAKRMSVQINAENGLENGLDDFNRHLPLASMVCDVATLMQERGLGRWYYPALRIKVCDEVHFTLQTSNVIDTRLLRNARPHVTKQWDMGSHVRDPCTGICTGAIAFVWELIDGFISLLIIPIKGLSHNGLNGLVLGLLASFLLLFIRFLYAPIILIDRIATGCANWRCCLRSNDKRHEPIGHVIDPEPVLSRIGQRPRGGDRTLCGPPLCRIDQGNADGASRLPLNGPTLAATDERRGEIEAAFTRVVALRRAFDALDASSNDDALSMSEVATLADDNTMDWSTDGNAAVAQPFSADRLPSLAELIGRYLRRNGKSHLAFAEFVLLSRDFQRNTPP